MVMLTFSDSQDFYYHGIPKKPPFYDLTSALQVSSKICVQEIGYV